MTVLNQFFGLVALTTCLLSGCVDALTKSAGCAKALPAGITQGGTGSSNKLSITSSGITRTYLLHLPETYTPTNGHGLIFSFHGRSQTGAEQERLSQFSNHDFNPNMLAVYPDGVNEEWQGDPDSKTNDIKLVLDLIDSLSSQYCIDTDRIFAAGKSNGGGFSANILACDPVASTKIAAFAGIAGAYYQGSTDANCNAATVPISCNPGRKPVPIFETHGSADGTIAYYGGPRRSRCLPTIPHFMDAWSERNGLGSTNATTELYNGNVAQHEYGKAANLQGINTHYWVNSLGHAWPSIKPNDDGSGTYFNATPLIMDFFNKWTLATTPITKLSGSSSTTTSVSSSTVKSSSASSTTSKSSSTLTTKTSSAASSSSTVTSPQCPQVNGTVFTTDNKTSYRILCGYDTTPSYFGSPIGNLASFGKCLAACDSTTGCAHVVYNGVCYLKKAAKTYKTASSGLRVAVKLS